jgi:hypothetical protein
MSYDTYTVTLTDLGTYSIDIVAFSPKEAERIAQTVLHDEAQRGVAGLRIIQRETTGAALVATIQPTRRFEVRFEQIAEHALSLRANDNTEAIIHAKRLVEENCGSIEFDLVDMRNGPIHAREIVS